MPDISMCMNDDTCPVKSSCYRSTASGTKPKENSQSYMAFQPEAGASCQGYIRRYRGSETGQTWQIYPSTGGE